MNYKERLNLELLNEEASVWISPDINDNPVIIVKAPNNTIKSLINGCKIQLILGLDDNHTPPVAHLGVKIFDFVSNPLLLTGTNRFIEENRSLLDFLENRQAPIFLYDELSICAASGILELDNLSQTDSLKLTNNITDLYVGPFSEDITLSLDCFDYTIDDTREFKNVQKIKVVYLDCKCKDWNCTIIDFIGLNTQESVIINNIDEGSSLESKVWFSIESIFNFDVHLNPQYSTSSGNKELTDILAFYALGVFLIESKCLSIFNSEAAPIMDKKVRTLKKHIKKGIKQLSGAYRNIRAGTIIHSKKNQPIEFNRDIIPHCIVLVSELLPFGDWSEIEYLLMKTMIEEKIYLHVMDFREFMNLVKNSSQKKEYFDYYLMERAEAFTKSKSIHMRSNFKRK
ncbi:hypothetical protein [Roseivirga thermotolerans]|uniref:hypothetical protein n=1 Tax=Roseivirga thermotolerans TaxID=1758176 RepID=UPI00273F9396|nr:hypothetical protein [Roseivirga thermotolerans]MEC7753498.1 hypothetical protein [Bacteroidota bacterium]